MNEPAKIGASIPKKASTSRRTDIMFFHETPWWQRLLSVAIGLLLLRR
jgi:hypothetical protein